MTVDLTQPAPPDERLLSARFASIGPTTANFLRHEHPSKFRVDVVSPKPDAQSLAAAICEFDMAQEVSTTSPLAL